MPIASVASILVRQCTLVVPPNPPNPQSIWQKTSKIFVTRCDFLSWKPSHWKHPNSRNSGQVTQDVHNALHWMYVAQIQSEALSMKQCSPQCIYTLKERVLWCRFLKYRCLWLQYFHSSLEGMEHQIFSELLFQSWWTPSMVSFFVCWNVVKCIFTNAPVLKIIN